MPVTAKVTFNLRYKQAGNSFSLYNVAPSLESLGQAADGKSGPVDRLLLAYMPLLGSGVECPNCRISDEVIVGDSLPFDRQYITISTEDIPATGINVVQVKCIMPDFPDFYDTSVLINVAASTTQKGRIFMRFQPDQIVNYPLGLNPDRNWDNAFKRFVKQLLADKWCIRSLGDANLFKRFPIKALTRAAADTNVIVETFLATAVAVGDHVRISRVKGGTQYNGIHTVASTPSPTTFTLLDTEGTALKVGTEGTARKLVVQYPQITTAYYRYATRRKSGRPFGVPRGRQPVR